VSGNRVEMKGIALGNSLKALRKKLGSDIPKQAR